MGVFFVQNDFVQCEANTSLLYLFTKQRGLALCRLLNVFQYAMTPLHFIYLSENEAYCKMVKMVIAKS